LRGRTPQRGPTIHSAIVVGANTAASNNDFYSGDIAEIIVYPRTLTSTERGQVEDYLNGEYNLNGGATGSGPGSLSDGDEYGVPIGATSTDRYRWLGAKQRNSSLPTGVIEMGAASRFHNSAGSSKPTRCSEDQLPLRLRQPGSG
jgi:hypothetical protein